MRKTKRGKFRKKHKQNKTRRRQKGGADFTNLLYEDIFTHDNMRHTMNNLGTDMKIVEVTNYGHSMDDFVASNKNMPKMDHTFNWLATAFFYSANNFLSRKGVVVYGNKVNEDKLLYWIRKRYFPNQREWFRKITDIKLELVARRK